MVNGPHLSLFGENFSGLMGVACLYCRRSHMTCDSNRPCARCVKRNIGQLCHDEIKERSRENGSESTSQSPAVDSVVSPDQHLDIEIKTGIHPLLSLGVKWLTGFRRCTVKRKRKRKCFASPPTTRFERPVRFSQSVMAIISLLTGAIYIRFRRHWQ